MLVLKVVWDKAEGEGEGGFAIQSRVGPIENKTFEQRLEGDERVVCDYLREDYVR